MKSGTQANTARTPPSSQSVDSGDDQLSAPSNMVALHLVSNQVIHNDLRHSTCEDLACLDLKQSLEATGWGALARSSISSLLGVPAIMLAGVTIDDKNFDLRHSTREDLVGLDPRLTLKPASLAASARSTFSSLLEASVSMIAGVIISDENYSCNILQFDLKTELQSRIDRVNMETGITPGGAIVTASPNPNLSVTAFPNPNLSAADLENHGRRLACNGLSHTTLSESMARPSSTSNWLGGEESRVDEGTHENPVDEAIKLYADLVYMRKEASLLRLRPDLADAFDTWDASVVGTRAGTGLLSTSPSPRAS